jgi:hypothetical protein
MAESETAIVIRDRKKIVVEIRWLSLSILMIDYEWFHIEILKREDHPVF